MLNKRNRLTKQKEVEAVFKKGKGAYNKYLGVKIFKNDLGVNRAAIIIGTKVSKKAVTRNKIKRRIAHILRDEFPDFKASYDMVVVVLPPTVNLDFQELRQYLHTNLSKLKVF